MAGRGTLAKSVISAIPIYSMIASNVPRTFYNDIEIAEEFPIRPHRGQMGSPFD